MFNNFSNIQTPRLKVHYTLGRIIGSPVVHTSPKNNMQYLTIKVQLLGNLNVSAFVGDCAASDGDIVAVKIAVKENGFVSYNICPLNDAAVGLCIDAVMAAQAKMSQSEPEPDADAYSGMSECDTENLPF